MSDHGRPSRSPSRRGLLGACAVAATAGLAGCASGSLDAETSVTREYDGDELTELAVETTSGEIDIREEHREKVRVEATKRAADDEALDDIRLREDRVDESLSLTVDSDSGLLSFGSAPRMDLVIAVPDGLTIRAETTDSDIDIGARTAERISADTTNGDIALSVATPSDIRANTTNGDVSITLPATGEPSVSFETTTGEFDAGGFDTGSIEADSGVDRTIGNGTHRIRVETTNGDLTVRGERMS